MQDSWRRRHAIQIAAALPEDLDDALIVLDLARNLIESFVKRDQDRAAPALDGARERLTVVSLSSAISGSNI